MTRRIVSISPEVWLTEAAELMIKFRISGLPIIDGAGSLCGILTEGDLLSRAELGTQARRPRWLEFLLSPGKLASEYVRAHGRVVREIMRPKVITVAEDAPLSEIVSLMSENGIKRVPVLKNGVVVGIVSRADVLRAVASSLARSIVELDLAAGALIPFTRQLQFQQRRIGQDESSFWCSSTHNQYQLNRMCQDLHSRADEAG